MISFNTNYFLLIYLFVCSQVIKCFEISSVDSNYTNYNPIKGVCLLEGDIVCPKNGYQHNPSFYMASLDKNKLWLTRVIPFLIASVYSETEANLIRDAVKELEGHSCVSFKELTADPESGDYIFISPIDGCYSEIGRKNGKQDLSLTPDCLNKGKGVVIHELIHAMGLWHEHTRPDRDKYIYVDVENIIPGFEGNFKRRPQELVDLLGEEYDYYSIMHYGLNDFSSNNMPTIRVLDSSIDVKQVGQREKISELDEKKLKTLYQCHIEECEKPVSPTGGSYSGDDHSVGAIAKYECESGMTLVGSDERFCRYNGTWSGRPVQCLNEPLHYCNFEADQLCGWSATSDSKFEWQRRSGATPQSDTGPIDDFTYETSRGHYIFMETSAPRRRGDVAKVMTPELTSTSGSVCVSFAYYMWGQKLGTLSLYVRSSGVDQLVWEESGNQGPKWTEYKVTINVKQQQSFNLIFEGIVGSRGSSDIALDEVLVVECGQQQVPRPRFMSKNVTRFH